MRMEGGVLYTVVAIGGDLPPLSSFHPYLFGGGMQHYPAENVRIYSDESEFDRHF
jgi:hypothetical protein